MPYIAVPVVADDEKMQELWHTYKGCSVAISADGTRIAVISGDTISLYDQYGLNPLRSFQTVPVEAAGNAYTLDKGAYNLDQVAISRDVKYVAHDVARGQHATMARPVFNSLIPDQGSDHPPTLCALGALRVRCLESIFTRGVMCFP